jgi:nitroreductase
MKPPVEPEYPVHELISRRWSPRAFSGQSLSEEQVHPLFEAVRWCMSSSNEQPWRFVYALRESKEAFDRLVSCLNEKNQQWAPQAAMLMLVCYKKTFSSNGHPNAHAPYDTGAALAMFTLQATNLGLYVHQMAGFHAEKARETFMIPADFQPITLVATGYLGDPQTLPSHHHEREWLPQQRHPQAAFAFAEEWKA